MAAPPITVAAVPTDNPDWFDNATTVAPLGLGWRLHRGFLATGRVGWVLQEREQAFHVLAVPETPTAAELIEQIVPKAGGYAADTLVDHAVATMSDFIARR